MITEDVQTSSAHMMCSGFFVFLQPVSWLFLVFLVLRNIIWPLWQFGSRFYGKGLIFRTCPVAQFGIFDRNYFCSCFWLVNMYIIRPNPADWACSFHITVMETAMNDALCIITAAQITLVTYFNMTLEYLHWTFWVRANVSWKITKKQTVSVLWMDGGSRVGLWSLVGSVIQLTITGRFNWNKHNLDEVKQIKWEKCAPLVFRFLEHNIFLKEKNFVNQKEKC